MLSMLHCPHSIPTQDRRADSERAILSLVSVQSVKSVQYTYSALEAGLDVYR